MARLMYTIWALMLNSLGMPIFQTCFTDLIEDEYGEPLLSSSLIASFFIATSVYVIVVNRTIFPESFRKPKPIFMFLYEFLVTAFFIEFVIGCVWTPIDVLVRITLPKNLCYILSRLGWEDTTETLSAIESFTTILIDIIAATFLLTTLHVTRAVNFKELTDDGAEYFLSRSLERLWRRIRSEFPKANKESKCRCSHRGKSRSKNRTNNYR